MYYRAQHLAIHNDRRTCGGNPISHERISICRSSHSNFHLKNSSILLDSILLSVPQLVLNGFVISMTTHTPWWRPRRRDCYCGCCSLVLVAKKGACICRVEVYCVHVLQLLRWEMERDGRWMDEHREPIRFFPLRIVESYMMSSRLKFLKFTHGPHKSTQSTHHITSQINIHRS